MAFEMTQIYETIADNLNLAHTKSLATLQGYTDESKSVDQLKLDSESLKSDSKELLANAQSEIARNTKIAGELDNLYISYNELSQTKSSLESNLNGIDEWIGRTMSSDETLTNLELDLSAQQSKLDENNERAKTLIDKISTLDSLRANSQRQTFGEKRFAGNDKSDDSLLETIEDNIRQFQASSEMISEQVESLKLNENFNLELEQIRDDIYELKMLIDGTRDIANEIKVAVNFTNSSFINLRPASSLKPSMVTTGSLYVQTRDMFAPIAYIYDADTPGQYISVNLQNGKPYLQYRISEKAFTSVSTDKPINNGEWHKIEFKRTGRQATLTVHTVYDEISTASVTSTDDSVVFNIDPIGAKFILGQYPPAEKLPIELKTTALYNAQFHGAIDDVKLDGHSYGLWSYEAAKNIKGEPKRSSSLSEEISDQDANAISFQDDSFMCLDKGLTLYNERPITIMVRFKTYAPAGLLWSWWENEGDVNGPYIGIYLESGYLNVVFGKGIGEKYHLFDSVFDRTDAKLNDNKPHTIFVRFTVFKESKLTIYASETLVNDQTNEIRERQVTMLSYKTLRKGRQCIGGLPRNKKEGHFKGAMFQSFVGCMSQLLSPGFSRTLDLQDTLLTNKYHERVSTGCLVESSQCEFLPSTEPVFLKFDLMKNKVQSAFESIGISFITASPDGMLFYRQTTRAQTTNGLMLQLKQSKLVLTIYKSDSESVEVASAKSYSDNKLHSVYLIMNTDKITLKVDNDLAIETSIEPDFNTGAISLNILYIAGYNNSLKDMIVKNYEGCITQAIYNDQALDFATTMDRSKTGMSFAECYKTPVKATGFLIPEYKKSSRTKLLSQKSFGSKSNKIADFKPVECTLSRNYDSSQLRSVGLRFGLNRDSRLEVHDSFPIKITTSVQLKFRTLQTEGLIFYASDAQFGDFLAIWLQEGYVNYAFDLGTGLMHVKTSQKYSDGRFHTLSASRDQQQGMLMISDRTNRTIVETVAGVSKGSASSLTVVEPFYFGGIPEADIQQLPTIQIGLIVTDPFVGCMSNFQIMHTNLVDRLHRVELMNCANNHESGTFFTGNSMTSYATTPDFINLKEALEISFEFKARTQNGVILYIGASGDSVEDYALLELVNGELVYSLNINGVKNEVKFAPKYQKNELCNSHWVRIQLRKETDGHISLQLKGSDVSGSFLGQVRIREDVRRDIYVGALPRRALYAEITETNEPFVGCVRNVAILKAGNSYNGRALLGMKMTDGVLNYCPLR